MSTVLAGLALTLVVMFLACAPHAPDTGTPAPLPSATRTPRLGVEMMP